MSDLASTMVYIDLHGWRPYANHEDFHGIDQYIAFSVSRAIEKRRIEEAKDILTNLLQRTGPETILRTAKLVAKERDDYFGTGKVQEVLFPALGLPSLVGMDCSLNELLLLAMKNDKGMDLKELIKESSKPLLMAQLERGDTFFLDPIGLREIGLTDIADRIEVIRKERESKPLVGKAPKFSSRMGLYDFTAVFSTARGFAALVSHGYGPWETAERAQEALRLLVKEGLIETAELPSESIHEEPPLDGSFWNYSYLFEGFSQKRIELFNSIVQSLDPDHKTRSQGVEYAVKDGSEKWLGPLCKLISINDTELLKRVIEALRIACIPESFEYILPLLNHSDREISDKAAYALGRIGRMEAIPHLLSYAESNYDRRGQVAVGAICEIGGTEAFEAAKKVLNAINDTARIFSISRLACTKVADSIPLVVELAICDEMSLKNLKISEESATSLMFKVTLMVPANDARDAFEHYGEKAVSPLIYMLANTTNKDLAGIEYGFQSTALAEYVKNRAKSLSYSSQVSGLVKAIPNLLIALGQTHSPRAIDALKEFVYEDDNDVSAAAVKALGFIGLPSLQFAKELLNSRNEKHRARALEILQFINHPDALSSIINSLDDEDENVQYAAQKALSLRRESSAVPKQEEVLRSLPEDKRRSMQMYLEIDPRSEIDTTLLPVNETK